MRIPLHRNKKGWAHFRDNIWIIIWIWCCKEFESRVSMAQKDGSYGSVSSVTPMF